VIAHDTVWKPMLYPLSYEGGQRSLREGRQAARCAATENIAIDGHLDGLRRRAMR
jgi:hypothetical protein